MVSEYSSLWLIRDLVDAKTKRNEMPLLSFALID